ncbi:hypothetical protein AVEN_151327-1 [Araneus ventricosus]|uniref:Uncharacterized protein n=1 Tax=Araneus ventricosus TaxID=182803 RepID=A0A4Y2E9J2_ARAVE|nr:hypothetical protein AVEN_151327-1 [Araneus ventricosus]
MVVNALAHYFHPQLDGFKHCPAVFAGGMCMTLICSAFCGWVALLEKRIKQNLLGPTSLLKQSYPIYSRYLFVLLYNAMDKPLLPLHPQYKLIFRVIKVLRDILQVFTVAEQLHCW